MIWILHFDGGCWPNPGGVPRYGWHLDAGNGDRIAEGAGEVDGCEPAERTNNTAEFCGLLAGLRGALAADHETPAALHVLGDSRLALGAGAGRFRMQKPHLKLLAAQIHHEVAAVRAAGVRVEFHWVPRRKNARADALAGEAR